MLAAAPVILGASVADGSQIESFSYDEFFNVLNATWPRSSIEYRDFDTLSNDIRRLFNTAANQIAARYLSRELANITVGSYTITQNRVVLLDTSFRVVEAGIALIIVCACMMALHSPWVPYSGASDSTALLAVVIARSDRLRVSLQGSGIRSGEHIQQDLSEQSFACVAHESMEGDLLQVHGSGDHHQLDAPIDDPRFWTPLALSKIMKIITLVTPIAIIASLAFSSPNIQVLV
jgi:hypothetical protein